MVTIHDSTDQLVCQKVRHEVNHCEPREVMRAQGLHSPRKAAGKRKPWARGKAILKPRIAATSRRVAIECRRRLLPPRRSPARLSVLAQMFFSSPT
jgi:hypothetical protein